MYFRPNKLTCLALACILGQIKWLALTCILGAKEAEVVGPDFHFRINKLKHLSLICILG
jgi:hypothetical protein